MRQSSPTSIEAVVASEAAWIILLWVAGTIWFTPLGVHPEVLTNQEQLAPIDHSTTGLLSPHQYFTENVGQIEDPSVRYFSQYAGIHIGFAEGEVRFQAAKWKPGRHRPGTMTTRPVAERIGFQLALGNGRVPPKALGPLDSYTNYYIGSHPDRWRMRVPHYERLIYEEVYPGIDLVYFFNERGQLTFEYHVHPGSDPSRIELRYTGFHGIELRGDGSVAAQTAVGPLVHSPPLTYQNDARQRQFVASAFAVKGAGIITVQLPNAYDPTRELVIDPTLVFSTYWGSGEATHRSVTVDPAGNIYMLGGTTRADWPTTTGSRHGGQLDVTIAKFDTHGKLLWSTLLGGPSEDYAYVSAVSTTGELYVSGRAGRSFPTTPGAFDRTFNGGRGGGPHEPTDAFVAKFSPEGQLVYSTYIGGNGDEIGRAIHLLPSGKLIVGGGNTTATNLPTDRGTLPGPVLKPKLGGVKDSWVAVVAADGGSLDFCTYFGPSDDRNLREDETIRALGVDAAGNIWIGGTTQGSDMLPTPDAFQRVRGRATSSEAYVAKISPDGKRLVYFSWLGGSGHDEIETEGVSDAAGNFYVVGSTGSSDFPTTPGAFQSTLKGGADDRFADAWVAKINNDGSLGFATLYGGTRVGAEGFFGPVVDQAGNVYCTGRFRSNDCPVTSDAFQRQLAGGQDAILAVFSPDGKQLLYASYFGGSRNDTARHIGIDPHGSAVYIIGDTDSTDLPLLNSLQTTPSGVFLAKFRLTPGWSAKQP